MSKHQFKPAWWLPGPHLQTLWPTLCRRKIKKLLIHRERIELPDGDFIDVDWAGNNEKSPIVLVLHGLGGSINSPYAKGMLRAITQQGWRGVMMHFRGCSGELNRLPRTYHSGDTHDLETIIKILRTREPQVPITAIGFSMGGNVLLKWLGETQQHNPLVAAIAISVPFELHKVAERVQHGFSRVYQWYMLRALRINLSKKLRAQELPIKISSVADFRTIRHYDEEVTAPLHGFSDAPDYYTKSSSRQYLKSIQVPTLLLQAADDPFMTKDLVPHQHELAECVTLELSKRGGHVGFVTGKFPWSAEYWLEKRVPGFLREFLT